MSIFSNTNFTEKTVGFSRIRTRVVGVEGEYADHLTTTRLVEQFYNSSQKRKNNYSVHGAGIQTHVL